MKSTHALLIVSCSLMLLGVGCMPQAVAPEPSRVAVAPVAAPIAMEGKCDHPYYPLTKGTKISFKTNPSTSSSTYSWEVTDESDDGVTITYTFSPTFQLTSDINCDNEGIRAATFLNMGSALTGGQIKSKTISATGDLLPKDFRAGSVWSNSYEVETENTMPDAVRLGMGIGHMNISTTNTAIGEESVTVEAGTFTAMKVESKMKMHMVLGTKIPPVDTETTSYNYFVRGKGLVKSEATDSRGTKSGMEAVSIDQP